MAGRLAWRQRNLLTLVEPQVRWTAGHVLPAGPSVPPQHGATMKQRLLWLLFALTTLANGAPPDAAAPSAAELKPQRQEADLESPTHRSDVPLHDLAGREASG